MDRVERLMEKGDFLISREVFRNAIYQNDVLVFTHTFQVSPANLVNHVLGVISGSDSVYKNKLQDKTGQRFPVNELSTAWDSLLEFSDKNPGKVVLGHREGKEYFEIDPSIAINFHELLFDFLFQIYRHKPVFLKYVAEYMTLHGVREGDDAHKRFKVKPWWSDALFSGDSN